MLGKSATPWKSKSIGNGFTPHLIMKKRWQGLTCKKWEPPPLQSCKQCPQNPHIIGEVWQHLHKELFPIWQLQLYDWNEDGTGEIQQNPLVKHLQMPTYTQTYCHHPEKRKPSGLLAFYLQRSVQSRFSNYHLTICWYPTSAPYCRSFYKYINSF